MANTAKDKKNIVLEPSERRADIDQLMAHSIIWNVFRPLLVVLISVAAVLFGCYSAYKYVVGNYVLPVDENDKKPVVVEIKYNSSLRDISEQLEEEELVRNASVFKYYTDFTDRAAKLKSGTFYLYKYMTMDEIIRELSRGGENRQEVSVTLVEGITIDEMAARLKDKGVIEDADKFRQACNDTKYSATSRMVSEYFKDKKNENRRYLLEGYLFPDTYKFFRDSDVDSVIQRLLNQCDDVVTLEMEEKAEALELTMDQAMILASLIEKEGYGKDFEKISAVFHNRLKNDMKLDSDATVNYIVYSKSLVLTQAQLNTESPYNTRINKGFPPGPICNPGKAALEAALNPDQDYLDEGYLYFTLLDPTTGEIGYYKTNKELEAAKELANPLLENFDRQNGR